MCAHACVHASVIRVRIRSVCIFVCGREKQTHRHIDTQSNALTSAHTGVVISYKVMNDRWQVEFEEKRIGIKPINLMFLGPPVHAPGVLGHYKKNFLAGWKAESPDKVGSINASPPPTPDQCVFGCPCVCASFLNLTA
jgi:hypothetical protein